MLGLERLSKASNAEAQESKLKVITEKHIQSVAKVMFMLILIQVHNIMCIERGKVGDLIPLSMTLLNPELC